MLISTQVIYKINFLERRLGLCQHFTTSPPPPCADASMEIAELDRSVRVVEYAVDMNSSQALGMALRLGGQPQLTRHQKDLLNKILANQPQWAPL